MPTWTPWGYAQYTKRIAEGITEYGTAGHGGIKLSQARYNALPEEYKAHKTFAGGLWYEEDCDWVIVALAFPEEFCKGLDEEKKAQVLKDAQRIYEQYIKKGA